MAGTVSLVTPIILCGGFGSRLWPLSREDLPKQFLRLNSKHSLFQETVQRMLSGKHGVFDFAKPVVATASEHRHLVAEQLREIAVDADILLEPIRRDSAAAVIAAAAFCQNQKREGLIMVVASDHAIPDVSAFHDHIEMALRGATDHIVLFGLQPQAPSTDYGYISPGDEVPKFPGVHVVKKFAEKPTAKVAELYVAQGYLWNSSNFVCKAHLLLAEAEALAPEIAVPAIRAAKNMRKGDDFFYLAEKDFAAAKALSIDFALLEKTSHAAVLPSNFLWSDLGTWKSIHAVMEQDEDGNAFKGAAQFTHANNTLVMGDGPLVAIEGLDNIVVAVTPDAILVASLDTAAEMKPLVEKIKRSHPLVLKKSNGG